MQFPSCPPQTRGAGGRLATAPTSPAPDSHSGHGGLWLSRASGRGLPPSPSWPRQGALVPSGQRGPGQPGACAGLGPTCFSVLQAEGPGLEEAGPLPAQPGAQGEFGGAGLLPPAGLTAAGIRDGLGLRRWGLAKSHGGMWMWEQLSEEGRVLPVPGPGLPSGVQSSGPLDPGAGSQGATST